MKKKMLIGGGGVAAVLLIALGVYLSGWGTGWPIFGGHGQGSSGEKTSFVSTPSEANDGVLIVVVEGSQYLVHGSSRSLDEVLTAAEHVSPRESGPQVLIKKKGSARYLSVDKLQKELDARKIRYHTEDDF